MMQFLRYLLVGAFNTLFGYCVIFACMYLLGVGAEASNVIGYACGLLVSYFLNRYFTFRSSQRPGAEMARFVAVFAVAYGLNFGVLLLLIHHLHVHQGLSQILAGAVYVGASYLMQRYYVFAARRGT